MSKFVVTVGREFGSLGRQVSLRTAELLGIQCYDRDVVDESAKRMSLTIKEISEREEVAQAKLGRFGKMLVPAGANNRQLHSRIFTVQECVIRDYADRESCIIVGRCADYVLQGEKELMKVFIYAPLEARVKNCVESLSMTEAHARKMCHEVDRARLAYHREFAGYDPMDPEHFDLMVNSALFGVEGTAQMLAATIKQRFDL